MGFTQRFQISRVGFTPINPSMIVGRKGGFGGVIRTAFSKIVGKCGRGTALDEGRRKNYFRGQRCYDGSQHTSIALRAITLGIMSKSAYWLYCPRTLFKRCDV